MNWYVFTMCARDYYRNQLKVHSTMGEFNEYEIVALQWQETTMNTLKLNDPGSNQIFHKVSSLLVVSYITSITCSGSKARNLLGNVMLNLFVYTV